MGRSAKIGEPRELREFKTRAKFLGRELGISRTEAMEALADKEGYLDFAEARKVLLAKFCTHPDPTKRAYNDQQAGKIRMVEWCEMCGSNVEAVRGI